MGGIMSKRKVLAIDPSIISLGWAVLEPPNDKPVLLDYGTVKCKTVGLPIETRMNTTIAGLEDAVRDLDRESIVVIEKPQLWGAYKSVASMHSGDLLGLYLLVGALYWWAANRFVNHLVYLIPVSEWKGQLPKTVTQKRMEKRYNVTFETDDEADACGLGTHFLTTADDLPF